MRHARHSDARAAMLARNLKRRAAHHPEPAPEAARGGDPHISAPAPAPSVGPWTLKQPPAEYLERYPDGKHAALARQLLAAEG